MNEPKVTPEEIEVDIHEEEQEPEEEFVFTDEELDFDVPPIIPNLIVELDDKTKTQLQQLARQLAEENKRLRDMVIALRERLGQHKRGIPGFVVKTPQPFNGMFAGVLFRNGVAFVPREKKSIAMMMERDFHYDVTAVDDWMPE